MAAYMPERAWIEARLPATALPVTLQAKLWHFGYSESDLQTLRAACRRRGVPVRRTDLIVEIAGRLRHAKPSGPDFDSAAPFDEDPDPLLKIGYR